MKDLKELREKNGFTQEQIASYLGVDQSLIAKYESGDRHIKVCYINALNALYGCDILDDDSEEIIIENRSSKDLKKEDLIAIAKVKKIAMNIRYMEEL